MRSVCSRSVALGIFPFRISALTPSQNGTLHFKMREVLGQEARWSHSAPTCSPCDVGGGSRGTAAAGVVLARVLLPLPVVKDFDNKSRTARRHKPREERMPKTQLLCLLVAVSILHTFWPPALEAHVPYTQQGVASW